MHFWVEEAGVLFLLLFDPKDSHTIRPFIGFAKDIGTPANEPMVQGVASPTTDQPRLHYDQPVA